MTDKDDNEQRRGNSRGGSDDRGARGQRPSGDRFSRPRQDGGRSYRPRPDGDRPYRPRQDGDRPRYDGDRPRQSGDRPFRPRTEGDRPRQGGDRPRYDNDRPRREGDRPFRPRQDGDRPRYDNDRPRREGDRPFRPRQDGDRPYRPRTEGDRPRYDNDRPRREGDRPFRPRQDGDRPYRPRTEGDRPRYDSDRPRREGDRPFRPRQDGDRPYGPRTDGDRPRYDSDRPRRDGDRPFRPRDNGDRGYRGSRPPQDDATRAAKVAEPEIPVEITSRDLHPSARNELKTLSKENAEEVARHLAMAGRLIDEDPERAHEHALAASRRAGRVSVVRETVAITAYATGDYALALRELRTYRRISGNEDQIALMVDSERGVGRPDRAIEVGRAVDRDSLAVPVRVGLAIALSGARLDLGETERALSELDIPELDPDRAFEWSPALFAARAAVLEELGRDDEAAEWTRRAEIAAEALDDAAGNGSDEEIFVEELFDEDEDEDEVEESEAPAEDAAVESEDADVDDVVLIEDDGLLALDDLDEAPEADADAEDDYSIAAEVEELLAAADAAADAPVEEQAEDEDR